jgi:Ca2+-binding EF-hand superfamily protein
MEGTSSEKRKKLASVLTSDVHNEAELIFGILENKDRKCISFLDCLTLLRGIGMNPTTADMDELRKSMAEPIQRLEEWRLEQERIKEKERKKEEKKDAKGGDKKKPDPKKDGKKGDAAAAPADGTGQAADGQPEKKKRPEPAEEAKNIDWNIFISCIEPIYRDNHVEREEIISALKVFDRSGAGRIKRADLARIVTTNGESVLSPAEEKMLLETLPEECSFEELAGRLQGTYQPPSAAELEAAAAKERAEREAREAAEKAAAQALDDPLAGL